MTVQAAQEMWSNTDLALSSSDGRTGRIQITKGYSVVADPTDRLEAILVADDLPRIMDLYPDSVQVRVTSVTPQRISPIYYIVLVVWTGETSDQSFPTTSNPVDKSPTIKWRNLITEEEIDEAYADDSNDIVPIATANHEPVRGITERIVDWVAIIDRNYAFGAFDLSSIHEYLRSVNSDIIRTNLGSFGPGIARLTKFEPEEVYQEDSGGYVKVSAEVTFRYPYNTTPEKAWWKRYLHRGYVMRVPPVGADPGTVEGSRLVNCLDDNKDTALKPLLLDADGFPIADPTDTDTPPYYREQRTLISLPYAALGLF